MNKKNNLVLKIISVCTVITILGVGVFYFIDGSDNKYSYFTQHFAISIILFMVGINALILPFLNKQNYSGENKGDSMMRIVGLLLMLCAIINIIFSYLG